MALESLIHSTPPRSRTSSRRWWRPPKASRPRCTSPPGTPRSRAATTRRHGVLQVVPAAERAVLHPVALRGGGGVAVEPEGARAALLLRRPGGGAGRWAEAEGVEGAAGGAGHGDGARIASVGHREVAGLLGLEEPGLGGGVAVQAVVAIEVIRGHVEHHRHLGAQPVDPLELEGGELGHHDRGALAGEDVLAERRAEVAADEGGAVGGEELAGEGGGGRLAVGAGDGHQRHAGEEAGGELDLAPDRDAGGPGGAQDGEAERHAGRDHHEVGAGEVALVVAAQGAADRGAAQGGEGGLQGGGGPGVGDGDGRPLAEAEPRRGQAAPRQADHGDLLALELRETRHGYLSLMERRATRASMTETIQKRTMIFGSAQPLSS